MTRIILLILIALPPRDPLCVTAHDDPERIIRQRSLQRLRFIPRCAHPHVAFFIGNQDHWHCLGMDRFDHRVRCRRQKAIDLMRSRHRLRLRAAITVERGPHASEGAERAIIILREPDHIFLLGRRVRLRCIFRKAIERDQADFLV
jgi:hypothetical protein